MWAFLDFYHEAAGVSCFKKILENYRDFTGNFGGFKRMVEKPVFFHFCSFRNCQVQVCLSGFGIEILNNSVFEVKYLMMHMLFDLFVSNFVTGDRRLVLFAKNHGPPGGLPDNIWRWKFDRPMHVPWL